MASRSSQCGLRVVCLLAALSSGAAQAATVFFCDDRGNVGSYATNADTVDAVGDLSAFTIGQVIGLAWDPVRQRILLLDREGGGGGNVYSMDPTNGNASLLFQATGVVFQGGAVKGNTLYGINEEQETVEAYDLTTFASLGLAAASLPGHTHGVGIDPVGGQLYGGADNIFTINDNGIFGANVVTPADYFFEDLDAFGDDFLAVRFDEEVHHIDGLTDAVTTFITAAEVDAAGVTSSLSGVVVAGIVTQRDLYEIPTLDQAGLAILVLLLGVAGAWALRRPA